MNNVTSSLILTTLAGLSTTLGFFIVFINGNKEKIISFFLSFAGGVMVIISIIDLIPSSFNYLSQYYLFYQLILIMLFIILGIFLSNYINHFVTKYENNSLTKLGILSFVSIVLHNMPEGIITFISSQIDFKLGLNMALAISLHNIPEGISIAIPLYYANKKKLWIFFIVLMAGLSEFLGAIMAYFFLMPYVTDLLMGFMLATTSGVMINIGLFSLLKEGFNYHKIIAIIGFVIGFLIMIISNFHF